MKSTTSQKLSLEKIRIAKFDKLGKIIGGNQRDTKSNSDQSQMTTDTPDTTDPSGTLRTKIITNYI